MKGTLSKLSMASGEIHPDLFGHTDLAKYQSGLKTALNVFLNKRGILYNCAGSETVLPGKFPTKKTRSIPFKFSFNQQYDLVFGNQYIHIIQNGVPVFNFSQGQWVELFPNGNNPTLTMQGGSLSNPAVTSTLIANGMLVQLQPFGLPFFLNNTPLSSNDFSLNAYNRWFIVQNVTIGTVSTTFKLTDLNGNPIDSTSWGSYGLNLAINTVYEIATPYADTDLALLNYSQSFDIVQLRHALYPRYQLQRFTLNNWTLTINNGWPNQIQEANNLSASGGTSGGGNYYYKLTTFNKTTQEESLPCPIVSLVVGVSTAVYNFANILSNTQVQFNLVSSAGLSVGQNIYFSTSVFNFALPVTIFKAGTPYSIVKITGNSIFLTNPIGVPATNPTSGLSIYTTSNPTGANQIASISSADPILITTVGAHGLTNGQEITIIGTGIYGLDGLTFNVTVQSTTTLSLNGVNGAYYNVGSFVSSSSTLLSSTAITLTGKSPTITNPIAVSGTVINPAIYTSDIVFLIYASNQLNAGYGFVGETVPSKTNSTFTFTDQGIPPDATLSPKQYTPLFIGAGNYPSDCNFYQQRLVEFATTNNPQGIFASVVGDYNDFTIHNPIQENDAIIINAWSNELNQIFHSADSGFLVLFTDMGPMIVAGDQTGVFSPSSDLIKRQMFAGASQQPRPLTIYKNIVYLEASQASIRDLEILVTPYYTYISKSDDVSIFSEHLLTQSKVVTWDYKLYPDSQIHAVRADGVKIINTYLKEQEINAFTRRSTLGQYLDVVCVQEGTETAVYDTVQRASGPWIERVASRYYTDPTLDAVFADACGVYDGYVNGGVTAVLSGLIGFGQVITATFSQNIGSSFINGYQINFKDASGNIARMIVTGHTSNSVTGTLMEAIESEMLGPTITDTRVASSVVGGLWHLNGQQVSVVGDGWVIGNPNDNAAAQFTVTNGCVVLPRAFGVIYVGLPYTSDIQTLDIDEPKGETLTDKKIGIPRVTVKLLNTGDIYIGQNFTENLNGNLQMDNPKFRDKEGYNKTTGLFTGIVSVNTSNSFGYGGSFALRNIQPLPMTVLSLEPLVEVQG